MKSKNAALAAMASHNIQVVVNDPSAQDFFTSYFAAKSGMDVANTMSHFSPRAETYIDAVLGWGIHGYENIHAAFSQAMMNWEIGLSYPTLILGELKDGNGSFLVGFTNTPEIVGNELRILAPVDIRDGRIVRWVDYWDSTAFDNTLYNTIRTPAAQFPDDFKEAVVGMMTSPVITEIATRLHTAMAASNGSEAAGLFDEDAVWEDQSLCIQIVGKRAIKAYFERTLNLIPFGQDSRLRHIVGGALGGGFEWLGSPKTSVINGVTALTINAAGNISRAITVYDSRQLGEKGRDQLILSSAGSYSKAPKHQAVDQP